MSEEQNNIELNREEVDKVSGGHSQIRPVKCPNCGGSGTAADGSQCPRCNGHGVVPGMY